MTWADLPPDEQSRIRSGVLALARLSWEYAAALIVATDGEPDDAMNTASGWVVELVDCL